MWWKYNIHWDFSRVLTSGNKHSQRLLSTTTSATSFQALIHYLWCTWYQEVLFSSVLLKWTTLYLKKRKKCYITATGNIQLSFVQYKLSHYATHQKRKTDQQRKGIIAICVLTVDTNVVKILWKWGFRYLLLIQISLNSTLK